MSPFVSFEPLGLNSAAAALSFGVPAPGCGVSGLAEGALLTDPSFTSCSLKSCGLIHFSLRFSNGPRRDSAASLRSLRASLFATSLTMVRSSLPWKIRAGNTGTTILRMTMLLRICI